MALSGESSLKKSANVESPGSGDGEFVQGNLLKEIRRSMQPDLPTSCVEPIQDAVTISADGGMHGPVRGTQQNSKAVSHHCTKSGCTKSYVRRGDLTRHVREAHDLSSWFRCPIERCYANSPISGFKRMHRLVEHLMKDISHKDYENTEHPRLFNQADATWLAHDANANRGDFQEIVFAASGAGIRVETESAITAYICRVPEKYVSLYFRVLCPVQECSYIATPSVPWYCYRLRHMRKLHIEVVRNHFQERHGYEDPEATEATYRLSAQAIEFAKTHPICGLDVGSSGYHH